MRRVLKIGLSVVVVLSFLLGCVVANVLSWSEFGGSADETIRARMVRSSQYVQEAEAFGNDAAWWSIHMTPEDSLRGHVDLAAKTLLPIHWGAFALSYDDWDEPICRAVQAAAETGSQMVTPRLGATVTVGEPIQSDVWWNSIGAHN